MALVILVLMVPMHGSVGSIVVLYFMTCMHMYIPREILMTLFHYHISGSKWTVAFRR